MRKKSSVKDYQRRVRKAVLRADIINSDIDTSRPVKVKLKAEKDGHGRIVGYKEDGQVYGIAAEVLSDVCYMLQIQCDVVSDSQESWPNMYASFANHDIDILAPMALTPHRKKVFNFSNSFYTQESIMVKRKGYKMNMYKSVSQMFAERIGVVKNSHNETLLTTFFHSVLPNFPMQEWTNVFFLSPPSK